MNGNQLSKHFGHAILNPYRRAYANAPVWVVEKALDPLYKHSCRLSIKFYGDDEDRPSIYIEKVFVETRPIININLCWISYSSLIIFSDNEMYLYDIDTSSIKSSIKSYTEKKMDLNQFHGDISSLSNGTYYYLQKQLSEFGSSPVMSVSVVPKTTLEFESEWIQTRHIRMAFSRRDRVTNDQGGFLSLFKKLEDEVVGFIR
jgi:hypothetical protein